MRESEMHWSTVVAAAILLGEKEDDAFAVVPESVRASARERLAMTSTDRRVRAEALASELASVFYELDGLEVPFPEELE